MILRLGVAAAAKGLGVPLAGKQTNEMWRPRRTRALVQQGPGVTALSSNDLPLLCWSGDKNPSPFAGNFV